MNGKRVVSENVVPGKLPSKEREGQNPHDFREIHPFSDRKPTFFDILLNES